MDKFMTRQDQIKTRFFENIGWKLVSSHDDPTTGNAVPDGWRTPEEDFTWELPLLTIDAVRDEVLKLLFEQRQTFNELIRNHDKGPIYLITAYDWALCFNKVKGGARRPFKLWCKLFHKKYHFIQCYKDRSRYYYFNECRVCSCVGGMSKHAENCRCNKCKQTYILK